MKKKRASLMKRGGFPVEQQTLDLEYEKIKQHNAACRGEWLIPPMTQCLIYLMACQYQHLHNIEPFDQFMYIRVKAKDLFNFYNNRKNKSGEDNTNKKMSVSGQAYYNFENLYKHLTDGKLILHYDNGDKEVANIFAGHAYYYAETQEIAACFNNAMANVYMKVGDDYSWINLIEMCMLPNDKYCRKVYQFVRSYKFKGQAIVSFEQFSKAVGSPYAKFKDFNRFILAPAKEDIEACTALHFNYEKVTGPHGKTTEIRLWFPAEQQAIEAKNLALAEKYQAEKRARRAEAPAEKKPDAPTNFTAKVSGTYIKRPSAYIIMVHGMIDYCNAWVKAHHGRWEGPKGGKYLVFEHSADADYFIEICEENGIPLKKK